MRRALPLVIAGLLVPLWITVRASPLMDLLPFWVETNLPRAVLILCLAVFLHFAWTHTRPLLQPALLRPHGRRVFLLITLAGLLVQWTLAGALGRGTLPTQASLVYGPIGSWPLLAFPLPAGWTLAIGLGTSLMFLTISLLGAAGFLIAWDQGRLLQGTAGSPALLAGITCPACLPPLLALTATGGLAGSLTRVADPLSPASASLILLGPTIALIALLYVHTTLRHPRPRLDPGSDDPDARTSRPGPHGALLFPGLLLPVFLFLLPGGDSVQQDMIGDVFLAAFLVASLVVLVVFVWMIAYTLRYRDREGRDERTSWNGTRRGAKVLFIVAALVIPAALVYGVGIYSDTTLRQMEDHAEPTFFVDVVGGQFRWEFHYPDGNMTQDTLYIPQGEVVQVNLTSKDVVHSLFIPRMGVKMDLVPGNVNQYTFEPTRAGTFQGYCAELCGRGHADMLLTLTVFDPEEFQPPFERG